MTRVVDPFAVVGASPSIELDQSQCDAIEKVSDWLSARLVDPKVQQTFRVGGHAGSGKTTIIKEILARFPELNIAVTTFTGKASEVLRGKGVPDAINLHQIFYVPDPVKMAEKAMLENDLASAPREQRKWIRDQIRRLSDEMFVRVHKISYDLIIVDEASMVPGRITEDLMRFGKPVLAVGDPWQLPPVDKSVFVKPLFADQEIDALLTGQHRHGNPLLSAIADAARNDRGLPAESVVVQPNYLDYDAVLVHTNAKRWEIIHAIRQRRGKPLDAPVAGDELMVMKNDHQLQMFNGSTFVVAEVSPAVGRKNAYSVTTSDGDKILVDARGLKSEAGLKEAGLKHSKGVVVASFCEAMTVHKAQGSEWKRVLVAQDHSKCRTRSDRVRWRYTAVTRAREALHVVGDSFLRPVV